MTWFAPSNDGGSQVTGYAVQWTESGGTFGANEKTTTSLRYTITGLTNGNEYDVRVIAVNANGRGTPSAPQSETPTTELVPSISAVSVPEEEITDTEAKVTLSIANADGTSMEVYLRYRTTTPEGEWSETQQDSTTGDSIDFTLTGLEANMEYEAQASLESSFPEDASPSSVFTTTSTVPGAPVNVNASPMRSSPVVSWDAPEDDGGSPITDYVVQWKSGEEEFDAEREEHVDGETFTFTITELDNDVEYTVHVIAMNANGPGSPSYTATGTPSDTSLGMIDSVMVESVGPTTAEVSVVVLGADEDHPVTVYMCYRAKPMTSDDGNQSGGATSAGQTTSVVLQEEGWSEIQLVETSTGVAEFTLTDLVEDTVYEIQVSLDETFADETVTEDAEFVPARVPAAPTDVILTPGDCEISVSWSPPADDGGSDITEYIVQWKSGDQEFDSTRQAQADVQNLMHTIDELSNGVEYDVQVIAINVIGEGTPSSVESATPTQAVVTTVAQVRILNVSRSGATAEVTLLNRDENAATTVYLRYRAAAGQQAWSTTPSANALADTVEFTLSGLEASTEYEFQASLDDMFPVGARISVIFTTQSAPQPPRITSSSAFTVDEGETRVATLAASDADTAASQLVWSILPASADGDKFLLSGGGSLFFRSAKDYENPDDANGDGVYELTVLVSDGENSDTATIMSPCATLRKMSRQPRRLCRLRRQRLHQRRRPCLPFRQTIRQQHTLRARAAACPYQSDFHPRHVHL